MPDNAIVTQVLQAGSPLTRKLAEIMQAVERVPKRGRNAFHGYQYATEADIADVVRAELASRSVVIYSAITNVETREVTGESGKPANFVNVLMAFTIVDGTSGEERTFQWAGAASNRGDKGLYMAITGAEKYFLLKLFLIPTGDDPEDDSNGHKPAQAAVPVPNVKRPVDQPPTRQPGDEPDDPFGDLSEPTDPAPTDACFVTEVREKRGESPNGPWTLYIVRFSDGREASTFDLTVASMAKAAIDLRTPMTFTLIPGKKAGSLNLVSLEPAS